MSGVPCIDCFTGTVHLGTPTGTTTTIHGLPVYVAAPPEGSTSKGVIVIIPDAFGWEFVNNRLLADNYAVRSNSLVYLPDFMNGCSLPFFYSEMMEGKVRKPASWLVTLFYKPIWFAQAMSIVLPWIFKNRLSICKPRIVNFFKAIRTSPPPFATKKLRIGAAGFCWGGYYTFLLARDEPASRVARYEARMAEQPTMEPLLDCAFVAHPSLLQVPEDVEGVAVPLSVAIGNEDMAMKEVKVMQMKGVLERKNENGGHHEVVIMPGAKHGFASRVDPTDKLQLEYAERAEVQAVEWFSKWFN